MEQSGILLQLKQKIIMLADELPKIQGQKFALVLGEKDPSSCREEILLNQRILLVLFTAKLLCEKLGVSLNGKLIEELKGLKAVSSKQSIPFLSLAAQILEKFPAAVEIETVLRQFTPEISAILSTPQFIAQDLLGKLYQELNSRSLAKPLNMNFTRWDSGFLLVGCAMSLPNSSWGPLEQANKRGEEFTIIDPACGTGGLLLYSYRFFREKTNSKQAGANRDRYIGLDVVPLTIHILSASWNLHVGINDVTRGIFRVLPLGAGKLGSLDLLDSSSQAYEIPGMMKPAQLVLMNPPFSRSSGSNTAFGTLPTSEQQSLGKRLKDLRKHLAYGNTGAAGQAADFILLAHKLLEPGGRLAVVLPISCLFGAAWTPVRRLLSEQYHIELIFTHPEAGQCNFSDKTHLSECMLIARKHPRFQPDDTITFVVQIRHLPEGEKVLQEIITQIVNDYQQQDPGIVLERDNLAISSVDQAKFSCFSWSWGPILRFANPKLNAFILKVFEYQTLVFSPTDPWALKLRRLESLGTIAHDRAAYRAIKPTSKSKIAGNYALQLFQAIDSNSEPDSLPAFWGRQNDTLTRWIVHPNALLVKQVNTTSDQFRRHSASRAQCLLPETLRFNTSSLFSIYCPEAVVSNVFWGFIPHTNLKNSDGASLSTTDVAKIITLWTNTTMGTLLSLAIADETDENLFHWKKQTLSHALLPDLESLSGTQVTQICALFDSFAIEDYQEPIQQRICRQKNMPLDIKFLQICSGPENWESYQSQVAEYLKELYQMAKILLYYNA